MLKIPPKIQYIIEKIEENGHEAYIVGGCVRDMLLGLTPNDFDITTSATPEEIISFFPKTIPTGIKHGTVTVIHQDLQIEVTTFRTEGKYGDNRHPESVEFVKNLKEDLSRRDFTVNAMAYNHKNGLQDFFSGKEDLTNKTLRAVGEPTLRFTEDALRILRLFRFSATLGFNIESQTLAAALECAPLLKNISGERIMIELLKGVSGNNPKAFEPLTNKGGLAFLKIENSPDYEKVKALRFDSELALFAFLYTSKANIGETLTILRSSNKLKNLFLTLELLLKLPLPKDKLEIKNMLFLTNTMVFEKYLEVAKVLFNADTNPIKQLFSEIIKNNEPYKIGHLKINGNDLLNLGITGEKTGLVLENLRRLVIKEPTFNTKKRLVEKATEFCRN